MLLLFSVFGSTRLSFINLGSGSDWVEQSGQVQWCRGPIFQRLWQSRICKMVWGRLFGQAACLCPQRLSCIRSTWHIPGGRWLQRPQQLALGRPFADRWDIACLSKPSPFSPVPSAPFPFAFQYLLGLQCHCSSRLWTRLGWSTSRSKHCKTVFRRVRSMFLALVGPNSWRTSSKLCGTVSGPSRSLALLDKRWFCTLGTLGQPPVWTAYWIVDSLSVTVFIWNNLRQRCTRQCLRKLPEPRVVINRTVG